jgi:hypothetical protein
VAVECLVIGTTLLGRPSILTVFGGFTNLTKRVSRTSCPSGPFVHCQLATVASAPLVMQHSVASLCFNMTGMPTHRVNFPGTCLLDDAGGYSHNTRCKEGGRTLVLRTGSIRVFLERPGTPFLPSSGFLHLSIE